MQRFVLIPACLCFLLACPLADPVAQIWIQNFDSYPDGTTNDPPLWTSMSTDCDGTAQSQWGVFGGVFTIVDTEGFPCCIPGTGGGNNNQWQSEIIDISAYCDVSITVEFASTGTFECSAGGPYLTCTGNIAIDNGHDQIVAQYSLDGAPFQTWHYICGSNGTGIQSVTGLNGMTLQIRIMPANKSTAEFYYFDDIVVDGNIIIPVITGIPGSICENEMPVALPTTQSGITGNWSGTGVAGNSFDPDGLSGNVTLTFTPGPGQCAAPVTTIISVNTPVTPVISGVPASICETDASIALPNTQSGITGNWSGPGVAGNSFDPSGLSGNITLTFTPNTGQCANTASTNINVNTPVTPAISGVPASLCETDASVSLPTTQSGITGNWSGTGVAGNSFDPSGLNGNITLTFTPNSGQCANTTTADINVNAPITPVISGIPASLCETDASVSLPTTQSGITGNWSGMGVAGNAFDPSGLSGTITLTFTPNAGQCANTTAANINVNTPVTLAITGVPTDICESDPNVALPTIQSGITGNWSGMGVAGNTFDPSGLSGNITLTFTPNAGQCANTTAANINVNTPVTPAITGVPNSICETDPPVMLPLMQSGITGNWSGTGISGNTFNPDDLDGDIALTFTPDPGQCALSGTHSIEVNSAPSFAGLTAICDVNTLTYIVSFDIIGGDPSGYTINGQSQPGTTFTSSPIASGTAYLFELDDGNNCGPVNIAGSLNCACATSAGTLDFSNSPLLVCDSTGFAVIALGDHTLDGDDVLQFILHTNPGPSLGMVIAISDAPVFLYPGNIILNQTYYVSAVAGTNDGTGTVDLNDPCLSVSQGIPVIFYAPGVVIDGNSVICDDDCIDIQAQFSGQPPFTLNYAVSTGLNVFMNSITTSNHASSFTICPSSYGPNNGQLQVYAIGITDSLCILDQHFPDTAIIVILPDATHAITQTLCPGDSMVVNGTVYNTSNPAGTIVMPNAAVNGCDSIVTVSLSFYPAGSFDLIQTLCIGGSIVVNGTTYDQANPSGTEMIQGATVHGCDSIINVSLSFNSVVTTDLIITLCETEFIVVQGTVYNAANPTGTETFTNGSHLGCDSVVHIDLDFYPSVVFDLEQTLCTGGSLLVNGTLYNEGNPSGTEIIPNGSSHGCDSVINVNLNFNTVVTTDLYLTLCTDEFIIIDGTVYDTSMPTGTEIFVGGSYLGCDSVVNVHLDFYPETVFTLAPTLCPGDSIEVNGTIYHATHPTGTEVLIAASMYGCDSLVQIDLNFYPPAIYLLDSILQAGQTLDINGTIYGQSNPTGTEIITGGSFAGCDSIIIIQLAFDAVLSVDWSAASPSCHGSHDGTITVVTIQGGVPPYTVSLDGGNPFPVSAFPFVISAVSAGIHLVIIEDAAGNLIMHDLQVADVPALTVDLGNDLIIHPGELVVLTGNTNFPVTAWEWMPFTYLDCVVCESPTVVQADADITYSVLVTDANGCTASDDIAIRVLTGAAIYVPTIFSPNADGINDMVMITVQGGATRILDFQIFNRWGELMHHASEFLPDDVTHGWDGSFKNKPMEPGVYTWMARIVFHDGSIDQYKGDVTLIR